MTKRALKRMVREGANDAGRYDDDAKVRRLPVEHRQAWSPQTRQYQQSRAVLVRVSTPVEK